MPHMTILQIDTMIHSLKQSKQFRPEFTLEEAYLVWKTTAKQKKK